MNEYFYAKLDFENWISEKYDDLDQYQKAVVKILYDNFDELAFHLDRIPYTLGERMQDPDFYKESRKSLRLLFKEIFEKINKPANREEYYRGTFLETEKPVTKKKEEEKPEYLTSLEVKDFRGFGAPVRFEFKNVVDSQDLNDGSQSVNGSDADRREVLTYYNLFYGPNGSGKTSFCEALEYCILGRIEDARVKHIKLAEYIVHGSDGIPHMENTVDDTAEIEKSNCSVELMCTDDVSEDGRVRSEKKFIVNPERYRFAFIERRRIDSFSHMDFHVSSTERSIAALFGHLQLYSFCNQLSSNSSLIFPPAFDIYGLDNVPDDFSSRDSFKKYIDSRFSNRLSNTLENIIKMLHNFIFKDSGPETMDIALRFYNKMNIDDADSERLEELKIVKDKDKDKEGYQKQIEITFKSGMRGNALRLLSEGHVKLLGLALLLAGAVKNKVPFLIFDDIVNAIDDDHRDGVAQLLVTDEHFKRTQLFLTCHGDVFHEQLKKHALGRVSSKSISSYTFLRSDRKAGTGIVARRDDERAMTKIELAQHYNNLGRKRECTAACRQALELIAEMLWTKIGQEVPLKVKMKGPSYRPELKVLVELLKNTISKTNKELKKYIKSEPTKEVVNEIHNTLEEIFKTKNWRLLNKGIHEDITTFEFTSKEVDEIVTYMETLSKESARLLDHFADLKAETSESEKTERIIQEFHESYNRYFRSDADKRSLNELIETLRKLNALANLKWDKILIANDENNDG